jgi:hypothetical protein
MELIKDIAENLQKDWEIALPETLSEQEIINILAQRIALLLDRSPEALFQLMYRIDISEAAFNKAVNTNEPALNIACLIYERQKAKAESRQKHKMPPAKDDESLSW